MTFGNMKDLEAYILSRSKVAILKAQEEIYKIIDEFVKKYYAEYSPKMYIRTNQLLHSLVKSEVAPTKNGWTASVYFDLDTLNYIVKSFPNSNKLYTNSFHGDWTHDNDIAVFKLAAHGKRLTGWKEISHGSHRPIWSKATAVWDEPNIIINSQAINILKKSLINAGIAVR